VCDILHADEGWPAFYTRVSAQPQWLRAHWEAVVPHEFPRFEPGQTDIDNLIRAAGQHPLGEAFLIQGHLGTVAIMFRCHAFTVAAARDQLIARRAACKES